MLLDQLRKLDSRLRSGHRCWASANGDHYGGTRLGCASDCEGSTSVESASASGSVYEGSGRAGHNCQFRTTWRQLTKQVASNQSAN